MPKSAKDLTWVVSLQQASIQQKTLFLLISGRYECVFSAVAHKIQLPIVRPGYRLSWRGFPYSKEISVWSHLDYSFYLKIFQFQNLKPARSQLWHCSFYDRGPARCALLLRGAALPKTISCPVFFHLPTNCLCSWLWFGFDYLCHPNECLNTVLTISCMKISMEILWRVRGSFPSTSLLALAVLFLPFPQRRCFFSTNSHKCQ